MNFVWPNLVAALSHAGVVHDASLQPTSRVESIVPGPHRHLIVDAIRGWPAFNDIAPRAGDFHWPADFHDVLELLGRYYVAEGMDVT